MFMYEAVNHVSQSLSEVSAIEIYTSIVSALSLAHRQKQLYITVEFRHGTYISGSSEDTVHVRGDVTMLGQGL